AHKVCGHMTPHCGGCRVGSAAHKVCGHVTPHGAMSAARQPPGPLKSTAASSRVRSAPSTVTVNWAPGATSPGYQATHHPSFRLASTGESSPSMISIPVTPGAYVPRSEEHTSELQ